MMHVPEGWAWQYVASNMVAIALLLIAWKRPLVAKVLFAIVFLGASYANSSLAWRRPEEYLSYDKFVLIKPYHDFITGFFAQHTRAIVLAIATGQFVIGVLLLNKGKL